MQNLTELLACNWRSARLGLKLQYAWVVRGFPPLVRWAQNVLDNVLIGAYQKALSRRILWIYVNDIDLSSIDY